MPTPRKQLVSLMDMHWYHCMSRCVRRSWLCGVDPYNGIDYSHRRDWVVSRMEQLVDAFSIDTAAVAVASFSVMSNHMQPGRPPALHVDTERAKQWSWQEAIQQWHKI